MICERCGREMKRAEAKQMAIPHCDTKWLCADCHSQWVEVLTPTWRAFLHLK